MITSEAVRMALTAVFTGVCAWYLLLLVRVARLPRNLVMISVALHVLMCLAMISMFWSWGTRIPVIALITVFTAGAAWFAGLALFRAEGLGHVLGHGAGRFANWYQAGMMSAMVWMGVAMSATTTPVGLLAASSSDSMPGMSGMGMGSSASGATASPATLSAFTLGHPVGWVGAVCLALCLGFLAAGAWFAVAAFRALATPGPGGHRTGGTVHDGMGALMAAGMGVALLAMA